VSDFKCSFCGKPQAECLALIQATAVFICDECVGLCVSILVEKKIDAPFKLIGDAGKLLVKLQADADAAIERARSDHAVIQDLRSKFHTVFDSVRELGLALDEPRRQRCCWCGYIAQEPVMKEHVATCDQHPAVIRLRELEAKQSKRGRRAADKDGNL
jgi:hypothetical protein